MTVNILQRIKKDLTEKYTFDLPTLRYGSPEGITVFLWDDLQDYITMCNILSQEAMDGYRYVNSRAHTLHNYIPLYDLGDKATYSAYCLSDPVDMYDLELEDWAVDCPLQVKGKLVRLSLKALVELDSHYKNENTFDRQLIEVVTPNGDKIEAYAYFNEREDLADYDKEKDKWKLKGDKDLLHFTITKDNLYEM